MSLEEYKLINKRNWGNWDNNTFVYTENNGIFANFSVILLELCHRADNLIDKIDAGSSFSLYKDTENDLVFNELIKPFDRNIVLDIDLKSVFIYPHDTNHYRKLENNFHLWTPYVMKYFQPTDRVLERVDQITKKYKIDYDNTLVVHKRSTDKWTEIPTIPKTSVYINKGKEILAENKDLRVLAQSDEQGIIFEMLNSFNKNCFFIKDLPTARGKMPLHYDKSIPNRVQYAVDFFASILIISKCKYVVSHHGNGAFWTALYRGNLNNFYHL